MITKKHSILHKWCKLGKKVTVSTGQYTWTGIGYISKYPDTKFGLDINNDKYCKVEFNGFVVATLNK